MTRVTCRLTAKNRDQLRNPQLGNRVWATFSFFTASDWTLLVLTAWCHHQHATAGNVPVLRTDNCLTITHTVALGSSAGSEQGNISDGGFLPVWSLTSARYQSYARGPAASCVYGDRCCDLQPWARAVHLYCSA